MSQSEEIAADNPEDSVFPCGDPTCPCIVSYSPEDLASRESVSEMVVICDDILTISFGLTYGNFIKNNSLHSDLILKLKTIQEASLALPIDFKDKNLKTDWDSIQTVYTQVVHPDLGFNPEALWDLIRLDLPFLRQCLDIIINGCTHVY
ncbi:MAG: hypothetical protein FWH46_02935 [Methanimicrococcus sp.]|nr:hypothetical protein [Methanimicrococcus sp.]